MVMWSHTVDGARKKSLHRTSSTLCKLHIWKRAKRFSALPGAQTLTRWICQQCTENHVRWYVYARFVYLHDGGQDVTFSSAFCSNGFALLNLPVCHSVYMALLMRASLLLYFWRCEVHFCLMYGSFCSIPKRPGVPCVSMPKACSQWAWAKQISSCEVLIVFLYHLYMVSSMFLC